MFNLNILIHVILILISNYCLFEIVFSKKEE